MKIAFWGTENTNKCYKFKNEWKKYFNEKLLDKKGVFLCVVHYLTCGIYSLLNSVATAAVSDRE